MRKKVFIKLNGVIFAVLGTIQHLAVGGHSSSTEAGRRLTQLRAHGLDPLLLLVHVEC